MNEQSQKMSGEEAKENAFTFIAAPIQVYLVNSNIYSTNPEDLQAANSEENPQGFVVTVHIYNQLVISLDELMTQLAEAAGLNFDGHQVLYRTYGPYILAGAYPFSNNSNYLNIASVYDPVFIKLRVADKTKFLSAPKRGNERKISDVIKALFIWRTLVMIGQIDADRKLKRYNRQEAAELVKIPKKTLEDYLLQIKLALCNGFDFNMYCNTRFGVVRDFNRQKAVKTVWLLL
eukprot:TRINITY_DN12005_c0_g1_i2.p1 TRINITY_DN12005_c0_g1~~TRINITY_DN12005_c0_g1_i2.p1  ORF type:complete len:233 (+),score=22.65 TRINITY_DN12005_c0_g1_i2:135-833(+)